jgi:hypothetical protein
MESDVRLSSAMMLGICRFNLQPTVWSCRDGGCLLGIAMKAVGVEIVDASWPSPSRQIIEVWPWLNAQAPIPEFARTLAPNYYGAAIEHPLKHDSEMQAIKLISFFAFHVSNKNLSIEKVVDWISQVEPKPRPELEAEKTAKNLEAVAA